MKRFHAFPLTLIAIMTALATTIYMLFPEIPLVPGVDYLKVDLSDIPALVTALTFGPHYGIAVEVFKNLIHLLRTTTYGIGELMNVCIGTTMMLTMWGGSHLFARLFKKDRFSAATYYASSAMTIVATIVMGWILNSALTPVFFYLSGIPFTAATIFAGVWGSTLLNAVKCAVTVLPFWPMITNLRRFAKKFN